MALNLSKLFGRGGETRLEGGKEGLATGSSVLDEHSDQPESIVILDNDGETEVARIAGAVTGAEGQSLYFEDSVRTAREAIGSTGTSPAEPLNLERDTNQGAVDIWEHAATAPRPDSVTEDMAEIVLAATGRPDGPETAIVDAADYTVWRDNLRTSTPPPGILPYIEQSNLVGEGKFTASEDQLQTLVERLQERGLIDTSTGEIVWADEASANFTGSDEELGALIAWLRTAQPADQPGQGITLPEVGDEVVLSLLNNKNPELTRNSADIKFDGVDGEAARSMQPGGQGQGFMMQDGELYPRGLLLPYMEQENLYQGTDDQVAEVIGHLRERGLIDTSTGEIVWADEATANHTGSDEELGALIAWLRGNNLIDTSTGEIAWARQPGTSGWYVPEMDSDQSGMAIENARSMQPGQQGEGFMMELDRQVPDAVVEDASDNILNVRGLALSGDIDPSTANQGTVREDAIHDIHMNQGNTEQLSDSDPGNGLPTESGSPAATGYTATDDLWKVRGDAPGFQAPSYEIEDVTQVRPLSGDFDPSTAIQGATEKIEGPGFAYNLGDTVTHREGIPGGSHQEWERPEAALEKIEIALADHPLADDVARVAGPGPEVRGITEKAEPWGFYAEGSTPADGFDSKDDSDAPGVTWEGPDLDAGKSVVSGWGGELIDTNHAPADTFAADAAQEVPYGIDLVRDDGPTTLLGSDAAQADPLMPQEQFSLNFTRVEFHGHDADGSDGDGDGFMDYTDDVDL